MQPASANASACTGDGPACPALSSTIDASPDWPVEHEIVLPDQFDVVGAFMATHCSSALDMLPRTMLPMLALQMQTATELHLRCSPCSSAACFRASCSSCAAVRPCRGQPHRCGNRGSAKSSVRAHLEFLASDALNGRGSGTRDEQIAAEYVGAQFRRLGLKPGGSGRQLRADGRDPARRRPRESPRSRSATR